MWGSLDFCYVHQGIGGKILFYVIISEGLNSEETRMLLIAPLFCDYMFKSRSIHV